MWFNKKAVERELDLAAEELDKFGYKDLADKVDYYNERLMEVKSSKEIPVIRRALQRVEQQASRRQASRRQAGKTKGSRTVDKRKLDDLKKKARMRQLRKALAERKSRPNARSNRLEALLKRRDAQIAKEERVTSLKDKVKARRLARLKEVIKHKR